MLTPDEINGLFEFTGSLFILNHCRLLWQQKSVQGVSIVSAMFFPLWGVFNIYYYPHLGQIFSFYGSLFITFTNFIWILMMVYFKFFYKPENDKTA